MLMLTLFVGFVIGALTIVAVEALGFLFLIRRLNRRIENQETKAASSLSTAEFYGDKLDPSCPNKQGLVWVLEAEKIPKNWFTDKRLREQKRKKEIMEVTPVRKYAKLKDQSLILTESDGSNIEIWLKGCIIAAVSATNLSSRKWAKRYPIKVDSKMSVIYHGSKTLYIYLETSWEKESWCKALRLASCDDKEQLKWFSKLPSEFNSYLTSLNIGYTSFMKPSMSFNAEAIDRTIKLDESSSKVRHFLKKLAKKASKSGVENKASWTSTSGRDDRRIHEKSCSFRDSGSATGLVKPAPTGKAPNCSAEENMVPSTLSSLTRSGSSDAESDDKNFSDEGTLCWNLLLSRMFFDAKSNAEIKSSMQARVQRTLSNMRRPSYIGEVTCTGIHPGNLPPYIHGMRVLPSDMNEVVALEFDIEYSGGAILYIETRFEVRELDFQEGTDTNLESSTVGEVPSDLLEGFQYFGEQLNLSEGKVDEIEQKDRATKPDEMKRSNSTTRRLASVSKWKSVVNSIAKQVSQVPLSLAIRVASLRGTLRLHIKPPPSDQLWFGFTAMPDVDFNLESSVGDHKITSAHIALFLINRFKAAIRETMVLPNCESICIPWMLAEKDDWVPRNVAPFIWIKQETVSDPTHVHKLPNSQPDEATLVHKASRATENYPEEKLNKANKAKLVRQPTSESLDAYASSSRLMNDSVLNENPLQELKNPLLGDEPEETSQWRKEENPEYQLSSRSLSLTEDQNHMTEGDDGRPRRMGTKARMLSLRKKMGEKLEEKRRHIEEKGRNIVGRMRGPDNEM